MFFGGGAGQRQKPVREVGRAAFQRPVLHRVGDVGGDRRIERRAVVDGREQLFGGGFRQVFAHHVGAEHVFAVAAHVDGSGRFRDGGVKCRDRVDGMDTIQIIHGKLSFVVVPKIRCHRLSKCRANLKMSGGKREVGDIVLQNCKGVAGAFTIL